ncbi:metallophosphoesterase family protein [Alicyclobacillus dauci]|uniref:DNA repair exonuclease n=1 Tax=Alicyclobacillus dauci TaxID=1475485 RepID=A0ABY6Z8S7_9BACL|nr:DNA repair exonuclease [Alicyclobacillus dauci]WAH38465.1 DNA repair exonuclease [Alicyclobacillus dauci]
MSELRILHTADVHLGTPFKQLSAQLPADFAGAVRASSEGALKRIVDLAIERAVDVVTIAGDLFDDTDAPVSVQYEVSRQFRRLHAAAIRVVLTHGNHDPVGHDNLFPWPENVHVLGDGGDTPVCTNLVLPIRGWRVQFSGFSYTARELYGSQLSLFKRESDVDVAIALYHGQIGQTSTRHAPYAAASVADVIERRDFDVWALGHVHQHQVLHENVPLVAYPGAPQGRDSSETGPHGVLLISVDTTRRATYEFLPTSVVEWHRFDVDVTEYTDLDAVWQAVHRRFTELGSVQHALVHLHLFGQTPLHQELADENTHGWLQQAIFDEAFSAWIFRFTSACEPEVDLSVWENSDGYIGELLGLLNELEAGSHEDIDMILSQLPAGEREFVQEIMQSPSAKVSIMKQSRQILLNMMKLQNND